VPAVEAWRRRVDHGRTLAGDPLDLLTQAVQLGRELGEVVELGGGPLDVQTRTSGKRGWRLTPVMTRYSPDSRSAGRFRRQPVTASPEPVTDPSWTCHDAVADAATAVRAGLAVVAERGREVIAVRLVLVAATLVLPSPLTFGLLLAVVVGGLSS